MKTVTLRGYLVWAMLAGAAAGEVRATTDLIVIVHAERAMDAIQAEKLRHIYLGHRSLWSDGGAMVPVMLRENGTHTEFVRSIIRRTPSQFRTHWRRAIFTGAGVPPREFRTEEEVVAFVAANRNAIGYIAASTPHEGVRRLRVVD